jgi:hypothetical protein
LGTGADGKMKYESNATRTAMNNPTIRDSINICVKDIFVE